MPRRRIIPPENVPVRCWRTSDSPTFSRASATRFLLAVGMEASEAGHVVEELARCQLWIGAERLRQVAESLAHFSPILLQVPAVDSNLTPGRNQLGR